MSELEYRTPRKRCGGCRGHGDVPVSWATSTVYFRLVKLHREHKTATAASIHLALRAQDRKRISLSVVHNALNDLRVLKRARRFKVPLSRGFRWEPLPEPKTPGSVG